MADWLPTVLVAEDDPITRQLLKRSLEDQGHPVLVASDGREAWSIFQSKRPRLVITNWRMPHLDGFELCERIREDHQTDYTFIIMVTSRADREAMVQGFTAGADDFIVKPFDRAVLRWRLHSATRVLKLHLTLVNHIQQLDEAHRELEEANCQMRTGLAAAAKSQRSLLPSVPPDVRRLKCSWFFQPCEHLAGDSLNLFKLDDHRIGFFLADVCGHGVAAALLAVTVHRILSPGTGSAGLLGSGQDERALFHDPGRLLTEANRRISMRIEDGEYFTAVYGVIDSQQNRLHYAGAGHPYPILISKNDPPRFLSANGFPIGFDENAVYESHMVDLKPGDRLCVYSDGIAEVANRAGEMFGTDRLVRQLTQLASVGIVEVARLVVDRVNEWAEQQHQQDDLSIIILELASQLESRKLLEPLHVPGAIQPTDERANS